MSVGTFCRTVFFLGILLWIITEPSHAPILTLVAVTIHECGHLLAAKLCRVKTGGFSVDSLGARLALPGIAPSYQKELAICAAGPLANLLSIPLIYLWSSATPADATFFISVSLALALLNLLPIRGFDGGRICYCLIALLSDPTAAEKVCTLSSFFFLFILWCTSVYLMMKTGADFSLFLFSASVFIRIFLQNKMP